MAERLTDQDLDRAPEQVAAVVSELRRLRGLIFAALWRYRDIDAYCNGCARTLVRMGHAPNCPIGALEHEAELLTPQ